MSNFFGGAESLLMLVLVFVLIPLFLSSPLLLSGLILIGAESSQKFATRAAVVGGVGIFFLIVALVGGHASADKNFDSFLGRFVDEDRQSNMVTIHPSWLFLCIGLFAGWFYLWWMIKALEMFDEHHIVGPPVFFLVLLGLLGVYNYFVFTWRDIEIASLSIGVICATLIRFIFVPESWKELTE